MGQTEWLGEERLRKQAQSVYGETGCLTRVLGQFLGDEAKQQLKE